MQDYNIKNNTPNTIAGVDTLYYFYESNDNYDDFFLEIRDNLDDAKARFEKRDIAYSNKDLRVSINNQVFVFNGKAQGFYWFTHLENYLTVGFKDKLTNKGLNDIQIQLNGVGIYSLGLKALLRYADDLLSDISTGYKPLTRVDLNIFVQSDLSWVDKDMFVSRKRLYATHAKEISSKYKLQTLYIGKKPFLLRLYDKKEELRNSKKQELMYEYFLNNGFNDKDDIFNVEFEMHREYFKTFKINTVDDLLSRAELLFQDCLNSIRLVDLSTIPEDAINSKNKNRALIHPLWQHLSDSYKLKDFLALDLPLERTKRKLSSYARKDAILELVSVARKAYVYRISIDEALFEDVLDTFNISAEFRYVTVEQRAKESKKKPDIVYETISDFINLRELSDLELERYVNTLNTLMIAPDSDIKALMKKHEIAFIELKCRGKSPYDDSLF